MYCAKIWFAFFLIFFDFFEFFKVFFAPFNSPEARMNKTKEELDENLQGTFSFMISIWNNFVFAVSIITFFISFYFSYR